MNIHILIDTSSQINTYAHTHAHTHTHFVKQTHERTLHRCPSVSKRPYCSMPPFYCPTHDHTFTLAHTEPISQSQFVPSVFPISIPSNQKLLCTLTICLFLLSNLKHPTLNYLVELHDFLELQCHHSSQRPGLPRLGNHQ